MSTVVIVLIVLIVVMLFIVVLIIIMLIVIVVIIIMLIIVIDIVVVPIIEAISSQLTLAGRLLIGPSPPAGSNGHNNPWRTWGLNSSWATGQPRNCLFPMLLQSKEKRARTIWG